MFSQTRAYLDKKLDERNKEILNVLANPMVNLEDAAYFITALVQDQLKMYFSLLSRSVEAHEAKAAFKVALDCVIFQYGMSVQIHDIN